MKFRKGDKVKASQEGIARRIIRADRIGAVATEPRHGASCIAVVWDGNTGKQGVRYHVDFLVLAEIDKQIAAAEAEEAGASQ